MTKDTTDNIEINSFIDLLHLETKNHGKILFETKNQVAQFPGMSKLEDYKYNDPETYVRIAQHYGKPIEGAQKGGWKEPIFCLMPEEVNIIDQRRTYSGEDVKVNVGWVTSVDIQQLRKIGKPLPSLAYDVIMVGKEKDKFVICRRGGKNPLDPFRIKNFGTSFWGPTPAETATYFLNKNINDLLSREANRALQEEVNPNWEHSNFQFVGMYRPGNHKNISKIALGPAGYETVSFIQVDASTEEIAELMSENSRIYKGAFDQAEIQGKENPHKYGEEALLNAGRAKDAWEHYDPKIMELNPDKMEKFVKEGIEHTLKYGQEGMCLVGAGVIYSAAEWIRKNDELPF
jgi:hypothetical protein